MAIQAHGQPALQNITAERLQISNTNGHYDNLRQNDANHESDGEDDGETTLLGLELNQRYTRAKRPAEETTWSFVRGILLETVPILILTTIGSTFTGELLEQVAHWRAIKRVNELYILIPMLNNLKGNLEMNLSSRLSTSANVGDLDERSTRRQLVLGNLSLLQVQALLVSAVAALLSFLLGFFISPTSGSPSIRRGIYGKPQFKHEDFQSGLREFGVMLTTAMASASISGLILGSFMCVLILTCRRWRRNPDNIAPPIASCLGDLLTLCIVGLVSSVLVRMMGSVMPLVLLVVLVLGAGFAIMITLHNRYVQGLIFMGWTPLLGAMLISSGTGMVLDSFVDRYEGFGLISIVLGGLPGSVGSVLISRLSTELHVSASNSFQGDHKSARNLRTFTTITTLFLVTFPVQVLFLAFIHVMGWTTLPLLFIIILGVIFCGAVILSLTVAKFLTQYLWQRDLDPDTYAMPIQSSIVDLVGQLMLVLCYEIAQALGADVKSTTT